MRFVQNRKNSFVRFALLSKIHCLITDKFISAESVQLYRKSGFQIVSEYFFLLFIYNTYKNVTFVSIFISEE
jgi:hypothetical protein